MPKIDGAIETTLSKRLIDFKRRIASSFNFGHWEELGLLTGQARVIEKHPRLYRSLSWNDEDYGGNVLQVLQTMVANDPRVVAVIGSFLDENFPGESTFVSAKPSERKITFAPSVFQIPDGYVELDLAAVMMPFRAEFRGVSDAIKGACADVRMRCLRADDIWEDSTFIQDIFSLIYRAQVVVVDFTGKNSNVMYETGIAHTLGKNVIPITQAIEDVPSDMNHHRALKYLPNNEGLSALREQLARRLKTVSGIPDEPVAVPANDDDDGTEIPF